MWNEFPGKLDLGGGDTGIDLVALTHEGDYKNGKEEGEWTYYSPRPAYCV